MQIIAGLGNPGQEYAGTRHNIGFMVVDALARRLGIELGGVRFRARAGAGSFRGHQLTLLKPRTYMNLSGESVASCLNTLRLTPESLIVVHDDLDLAEGRVLIKARGGDGGHRGIRSIIDALDTDEFVRVRVGIGRPPAGVDPVDWVLNAWGPDEREKLEETITRAAEAALAIITRGLAAAMNRYNRTPKAAPEPKPEGPGPGE